VTASWAADWSFLPVDIDGYVDFVELQKLPAALPKQVKDRQDRKAAYEVSKKDISRWTPLIKANREAATLRLKQDSEVTRVTSAAGLASRHEAMSNFEKEVASLLQEAGHASAASVQQVSSKYLVSTQLRHLSLSCCPGRDLER
jgi:U3 small nucleolar RNA-associated protein 14